MSQPAGFEPEAARAELTAAVVVGVDGSEASRAAIEVAEREARYRQAPLIAVQAYNGERVPGSAGARLSGPRSADDERQEAESALRGVVRDVLGDRADGVEVHAVLGLAGRKIIELAQRVNAQLIVLASRGSASLLLGTVSQYVLRKAPCPVMVVPTPQTAAPLPV